MITLKVLFVEGDRGDQLAFEQFVEEHNLPITYVLAGSLKEAIFLVTQGKFDMIVANLSLVDGTAMDVLPLAPGIPVILIASMEDEGVAARACTAKISDYLVKDAGRNYLKQLPKRMEKAMEQRMRLEEVSQENQALYRRVVETANEGIWIADQDYVTSFVNQRMAEMLGYGSEEMVGRRIQTFLFPEDLADFADRNSASGRTAPSQYERRFRHKDGSARWTIISVTATNNEQGEFRGSFAMVTDITERKREEEALLESEEWHRALVETSGRAGISIVVLQNIQNRQAAIVFVNEEVATLSGYSREELLKMSLEDLLPPDVMKQIMLRYRDRQEGKPTPNYYETVILNRDRVRIPVICSAGTLKFHGKTATVVYVRDITELKQAEEDLKETEERFHSLFRNSTIGLYRTTPNGKILLANPALCQMLGFTTFEDLAHRNLEEEGFEPGYSRQKFRQELEEKGEIRALESAWKRMDGTSIFVRESVRAVRDSQGHTLYYEGTVEDITERKRAEEALRESEAKYRSLVETAIDGVASIDLNGNLTFVNEALCRITGYTQDELLNKPFAGVLHPDDLPALMEAFLNTAIGTMSGPILEFRAIQKTGQSIWLSTQPTAIVIDGKAIGFNAILHNISERKQLEERIRQVRHDLLFAVSHDLKTPLQALNQSQEMLDALEPGKALARFQEYREIWRRNLQRLERMINNLVDSQHHQEDRFPLLLSPCRLEEIVQQVVEDLTGYALSSQVSFDLNLQPVPEVSCDEEAIGRVVENLLTNAIKFSQKGGRVEVRLGMEGGALLLEVEDYGVGIPANEQAQLFQPFQRASSAKQKGIPGTGLGLYVCRRIVEEHGGSISLRSEEGVGTIVTVRLPWGV